jgi:sulfatase maturation enzyme AslB (radical SAM superfamily)
MGGETLLTDKFEDLVDFMILHNRLDLNFSFVTNGTKFDPELITKLKKFKRVGIEISIESMNQRNDYIRQGSDVQSVLHNISQYRKLCDNSSTSVALRTAPGLLSLGDYMDLLDYAWKEKLVVKSNIVLSPQFLSIQVLPDQIKKLYLLKVEQFLSQFDHVDSTGDYNASDPNNIDMIIKEQAIQCRTALQSPAPVDADNLLKQFVQHCQRWDAVYKLNASELYPELTDIFDQYGYQHVST